MAITRSTINEVRLHFPHAGRPPDIMANERDIALKDLAAHGHFQPTADKNGPYRIDLSVNDNRLLLKTKNKYGDELPVYILSLSPYRRLIKDYFLMISSYEEARLEGNRAKLEAIDMGRRGLHNEAAELMMERLKDKIDMDLETARRFFTLICVLHAETGTQLWR